MRESLIDARAVVGDAVDRLQAGTPIAIGQQLPWADETAYRNALFRGTNQAVAELRAGADPNGRIVAERFKEVQEALQVIADLWEPLSKPLFRAALAALDTAAFRVDPWLTGIAERRLQQMITTGAPFRLGAYGWVDAPAPYAALPGGPLAPGPTAAGLLHAPSSAQALTAAILRDAAVRYPGDNRWKLDARLREDPRRDGARRARPARASSLRSARSRSGTHRRRLGHRAAAAQDLPARQRSAGAPRLRRAEGAGSGARTGRSSPVCRPILPLASRRSTSVLDTYGDLLVTDGVHALVDRTRRSRQRRHGSGRRPGRAARTARRAHAARGDDRSRERLGVAAGDCRPPGPNADPARMADPAFAAAVDAELGAGVFDGATMADVERRRRLAAVLGGADDDAPVPSLTGGGYEGLPASADADLRRAIATDLRGRLTRVVNMAQQAPRCLALLVPNDGATDGLVDAAVARWRIDLDRLVAADPAADGSRQPRKSSRMSSPPSRTGCRLRRLSPRARAAPRRQTSSSIN